MDIVVGRACVIGAIRWSSSRQAPGVSAALCVLYQPVTVASAGLRRLHCFYGHYISLLAGRRCTVDLDKLRVVFVFLVSF